MRVVNGLSLNANEKYALDLIESAIGWLAVLFIYI